MGGKAYIPLHPRRTMLDNHHIISHDILIIPLFFFKSPCRTQSKAKSPEIYHYGSDRHVLPPALLSPSMFLGFDPKTENGTEKRKRKGTRNKKRSKFVFSFPRPFWCNGPESTARRPWCSLSPEKNRKAVEKTWNTMRQWALKNWQAKKNTRGIGEKHIVVCILHLPDILEALG